jgi:murein L,D-transpeptidase YcbB/YkuD
MLPLRCRAVVLGVLLAAAPALPGAAQSVLPVAAQAAPAAQPRAFVSALAAAAAEDEVVAGFFRDRGYLPLWTGPEDAGRRAALMAALDGAAAHGLPTARYAPAALAAAFAAARTEGDRGRLEVRMTRALLDYARDVQTGALVPARVDDGIKREVPLRDRRATLDAFAAAAVPAAVLRGLPPQSQEYAQLMKARLTLLADIAAGGWGPEVPAGRLEPGATGAAVVALRDRLIRLGYLHRTAVGEYDAAVARAVRDFQADHGIDPDGVAGASTLAALNVGPAERLRAVTVAMERERWLNLDRGSRHIWVNLADQTAKVIDEGRVSFVTRAVIGDDSRADKHTPEFSHLMTYMELNPDWTVPPGIIKREYLARLQANPNALRHLTIYDRSGRPVSRGSVDFSAYSANNFPFTLRQAPGDGNALGKVKFMFPNPHSIYLHDTPHKEDFVREERALSNGCIRLAEPMEFAYTLLAAQEADPRAAFHALLDTGRQTRLPLATPVPVHLDYRTAFADPRGHMEYRRDVYGRDAMIWEALVAAGVAEVGAGG